jgi:small subunit ribosomal protein S18
MPKPEGAGDSIMNENNESSGGGERGRERSSGRDSRTSRPARGGSGGGGDKRRFFRRRKVDYFSVNKLDDINYKDVDTLKQFVGERGKILPRRHTGLSARHQRLLKRAIKRARNIALLPFAGEA